MQALCGTAAVLAGVSGWLLDTQASLKGTIRFAVDFIDSMLSSFSSFLLVNGSKKAVLKSVYCEDTCCSFHNCPRVIPFGDGRPRKK